jgi:hypothetical protein
MHAPILAALLGASANKFEGLREGLALIHLHGETLRAHETPAGFLRKIEIVLAISGR